MDCHYSLVTPPPQEIGVQLATERGAFDLPRGALVEPAALACPAGSVGVEVRSTAGWYTVPVPAVPGERGCVAAAELRPVREERFVALAPGPVPPGTVLDGPARCGGGRVELGGASFAAAEVAALRAVAPGTLRRVEQLQATYTTLFGPIDLAHVPWTDEGYVGLPLPVVYDASRLAAERAAEGLDTPARQERALVAEGPGYAHFWGADAPWSDLWARPDTVEALLRAIAAWTPACLAAGGTERTCRVQIGDLAWYNDKKPDPLGHKDHREGRCVDLRLLRTDGAGYEAWWTRPDDRTGRVAYDPARTAALLRSFGESTRVEEGFFNDPAVRAEVPWLRPLAGHDDHVHLCLSP